LVDLQVATVLVIVAPLAAPGVYDTFREPTCAVAAPGTARRAVGALGAVGRMKGADASDCALVPTPFVAVTRHV
jgi:hypothetical protein